MLEGRSDVHVRPSALHPSPAPLASLFSRGFTPAELLTRPARRLAPRKSAFLLLCYQISVGIKLSGYVHYRPRVSLPGGVQEPLLGVQHPPLISTTCPWGTSQCQKPSVPPHQHGHWGWQICHRELCSALGSHLPARVNPPCCAPHNASL